MMRVLICLCLSSYAAAYTPRMFRPGGKYYTAPANAGGIDDKTRQELSGILNGILTNLQHHKAALPQVAIDIVQQYKLSDKSADLTEGLRNMYEDINAGSSDAAAFNAADKDVQGKAKVVLASVLQKVDSSYTPRMFAAGGKYYKAPSFGRSRGGISEGTRQEVGKILNGILSNLMKHKAALPQVATDIVQQYKLSDKNTDLTEGLRNMYEDLNSGASDEAAFNTAGQDVQGKAKVVLASVLQKVDSSYTPRMFAPGGKFYKAPSFGRSRGGISEGTRQEVGKILNGILGNLMKHKAALTQANELVQQFHIDAKPNPELTEGLMDVYEELQTPASRDSINKLLKDEKAFSTEVDRSQASAVLALIIQQGNTTGPYRPRKYGGYIPSRSKGLGISKGTKDQVAGILNGILKNLMSHKAALGQLADDVTKKYQGNTEVAEALQGAYQDLTNQKELAGATKEVQGQVKTVLASVLAKVSKA